MGKLVGLLLRQLGFDSRDNNKTFYLLVWVATTLWKLSEAIGSGAKWERGFNVTNSALMLKPLV